MSTAAAMDKLRAFAERFRDRPGLITTVGVDGMVGIVITGDPAGRTGPVVMLLDPYQAQQVADRMAAMARLCRANSTEAINATGGES